MTEAEMTEAPKYDVSVVIPSHNRREMLERCLDALARQDVDPGTFEVIIVDDGSSDGATEMVEGLETPYELRLLRQDRGGSAAARNVGIEASAGRICVLIDNDIVASPGLVAAHVAGHARHERALGIGPLTQIPPRARDWFAHTFAAEWDKHYADLRRRPATWMDCYGGNFSAPRAALLESGGYAAELPGAADVELPYRLWRAGFMPRLFPEADAVHDDQKVGSRVLKDSARRGRAYLKFAGMHPAAETDLLGSFQADGSREVALRRILISLRVPPGLLVSLGRLVPSKETRVFLHHAIQRYAFWLSVRRGVDGERWRQLTRGSLARGPSAQVDSVAPESRVP
jgi:glycosyltransferase involved in cell wall biosynthesis